MIKIKFSRKRLVLAVAMLPLILLSAQAFGQSSGLSGTVADSTGAVLPGAIVAATNNETGIKTTTTTNNAGVYNFAALPFGKYQVSAEMPGFQTATKTDVDLGIRAQLRVNFELQVSGIATQIEITTSAADMLLESSSSTGTVLSETVVKELPLVSNDMMQLINVMGGVVKAEDAVFGNSSQTFAGVNTLNVNLQRDGITVSDVRFQAGITSPGRINPEMVGEFKMILSPVDAESGRGAGQVQVLTKSGGNEYHGSGVWSIMNTALDANEWQNNRTNTIPNWRNINEYTVSVGGPVVKNKTFFFASWDHNIVRQRTTVRPNVLTPCARKGIYRWFATTGPQSYKTVPGWIPGNVETAMNTTRSNATRASVNSDGTPKYDYEVNGVAYRDELQYQSVLGELTPEARAAIAADPVNCSQFNFSPANPGVISGTNWNTYRKAYDTSGFIENFTALMPAPNDYTNVGDGLNTSAHRWTRTTKGQDSVYGTGQDNARKSITVKIDHNLNAEHRLSGTYSYESSFSDSSEAVWPAPNGYGGASDRKPQTWTASLTSTLRPTLLNEFRFGMAYSEAHNVAPYDSAATGEELQQFMQTLLSTEGWSDWDGLPTLIRPGSGSARFDSGSSHPVGGRWNVEATWGNADYRWSAADTVTWTKGSHSIKFGTEIRLNKARSDVNGNTMSGPNTYPVIAGGNTSFTYPSGDIARNASKWPGMVGNDTGSSPSGTYGQIYNLMNYTVGSVASVGQYYFANDAQAQSWSDPSTPEGLVRRLSMNLNEYSFFFKDDWKVTRDLTLNLGLRYEYYGVPWMLDGLTVGYEGGPMAAFGGSGGDFTTWHQDPALTPFNPDILTTQKFIGPDSPNPDESLWNKDLNNFGPAVGFAWQLPWWGKGKTTLRGGYQLSYSSIGNLDPNAGPMGAAGSTPSTLFEHTYIGDFEDNPYMDLSMLENLIPTSKFWDEYTPQPLQVRTVPASNKQSVTIYDENIRSPYIQSLTMSLTRQIGSSLTVDVRYIGTLSRKQLSSIDLDQNNWLRNGLAAELDIVRRGGESEMINKMIPPGVVFGPPFWTGSEQLRQSPATSADIAEGDYNTIATYLATDNGTLFVPSNTQGGILRNTGLFPENFIRTNPQYSAVNYNANMNRANYHSLQTQITLRPTNGLSFQASYTWSRNLGIPGTITDPLDRDADYGILGMHRSHSLTTYGTYNLPLGPSGIAFRDSSGWVRKVVEGWQLSWVSTMTSGTPGSVAGASMLWGNGQMDLVRPDLFSNKGGHVTWEDGAMSGRYFGTMYTQVPDPQCYDRSVVKSTLQQSCVNTRKALALRSDPSVIVFQHPKPGVRGNFAPNQLTGPGRWGLDVAVSKNIEFMEGKSINFRMDIQNIFNHPTPSGGQPGTYNQRDYSFSNPTFGINSSDPFGYIGYKGGHRVFSAKIRVSF